MQLSSRLRQTTLGDLLAMLHREGASGVLELIEPHARHAIHLRRGMVQAVESDSVAARLGDVATRAHGIPRPLIERARFVAQTRGLRLGQAMVAAQVITPSDLDELLATQQRERLEALYALPDAEVRFRVARRLPVGASEQTPLSPREVFHGRPRRRPGDTARAHARPAHPKPTTAPSATHAVLGVTESASAADVRAAFKKLVLELHPDRAPHATDAEKAVRAQRLMQVIAAYRALGG